MWIYLAAISAIILGFYDISKKHALVDNAVLPVLLTATCFGTLSFLPIPLLSYFDPSLSIKLGLLVPHLSLLNHLLVLLKSTLVASSWVLGYFALKNLPVSIASPLGALGPVWTLLGAILLFGEHFNTLQWIGLVLTLVSYYLFSTTGKKEGIDFRKNKWVYAMGFATILSACSGLYDKFLVPRIGALGVQAWFSIYLVVVLIPVVLFVWYPRRSLHTRFAWKWSIPCIGVLLIIADFAYFRALQDKGALIGVVTAIRRSSVVISFLGGSLLFKEKQIARKAAILSIILIGVGLMLLSGK